MIFKLLCFGEVHTGGVIIVLSFLLFKLFATLLAALFWSLFLLLVIFLRLLFFLRILLVPDRLIIVIIRFGAIIPFVFWNVRGDFLLIRMVSFIRIL